MFIRVTQDLKVALEDTHDFKRFKLVIDAPRENQSKLATALSGVATLSDDGHAWVSETWLRQRDAGAPWQDGLTAMIGVAKKYGWVNEGEKTIRAHVEWSGDAPARA